MDIKQRIVHGFSWLGCAAIFSKVVYLLATIVLVRLLLPTHFGIITTAFIYINFLQMLHRGIGLSEAVVQQKGVEHSHFRALFSLYFIIGIFFVSITYFIAPFVSRYFSIDILVRILRVLSVVFIFDSLTYVFEAIINRRLAYKSISIPQMGGMIGYAIFGSVLAFITHSVWSLVIAVLSQSIIRCLLSWKVCEWKPRFTFRLHALKDMCSFGKNVFGAVFFNYLSRNLDLILISKFLGVTVLGYYFLAYSISHYFYNDVAPILYKVLFPAFSRIRDEKKLFKKVYLKVVQIVTFLNVPLSLLICINAKEMILLIFGAKWLSAIIPLQILAINGLFTIFVKDIAKAVCYSRGRPDTLCWAAKIYCAINCIFVFIGISYGVIGVAVAVTFAEILNVIILVPKINQLIDVKWKVYFNNVKNIIISNLMSVVLLVCLNFVFPVRIEYFLLKIALVAVFYLWSLTLMKIHIWQDLKSFYRMIVLETDAA